MAADIAGLAGHLGGHCREQEGVYGILDIGEVAQLLATPNLEIAPLDDGAQPDPDKGLTRVLDPHPWSVSVGQPQRATAHPVNVVIESVIGLARHLVDAVDVDWMQDVLLIDRRVVRPAIDLSGTREDDLDAGIDRPAGLEQGQLRPAVDFEIDQRVGHRIEMAGLSSQVEEIFPPVQQMAQPVHIADVGDIDGQPIGNVGDVEEIAAIFRDQAVDQQHVAAKRDEPPRQGRADEAEPTGDQNARAGEVGIARVGRRFRRRHHIAHLSRKPPA